MLDPTQIKKDFPILNKEINGKSLVFLDNASTSQKPQIVIDTIKDFYENYNANINRGVYYISELASVAFEEVRKQARKRGLRVTGSEIVGLIPKEALIDAGLFYLEKQNKSRAVSEEDIIHIAIESLGLNDISTFDPILSIVENRISSSNYLANRANIGDASGE